MIKCPFYCNIITIMHSFQKLKKGRETNDLKVTLKPIRYVFSIFSALTNLLTRQKIH